MEILTETVLLSMLLVQVAIVSIVLFLKSRNNKLNPIKQCPYCVGNVLMVEKQTCVWVCKECNSIFKYDSDDEFTNCGMETTWNENSEKNTKTSPFSNIGDLCNICNHYQEIVINLKRLKYERLLESKSLDFLSAETIEDEYISYCKYIDEKYKICTSCQLRIKTKLHSLCNKIRLNSVHPATNGLNRIEEVTKRRETIFSFMIYSLILFYIIKHVLYCIYGLFKMYNIRFTEIIEYLLTKYTLCKDINEKLNEISENISRLKYIRTSYITKASFVGIYIPIQFMYIRNRGRLCLKSSIFAMNIIKFWVSERISGQFLLCTIIGDALICMLYKVMKNRYKEKGGPIFKGEREEIDLATLKISTDVNNDTYKNVKHRKSEPKPSLLDSDETGIENIFSRFSISNNEYGQQSFCPIKYLISCLLAISFFIFCRISIGNGIENITCINPYE